MNKLGQHGADIDHPAAWLSLKVIGLQFLESQHAILKITTRNTQNSGRRIS